MGRGRGAVWFVIAGLYLLLFLTGGAGLLLPLLSVLLGFQIVHTVVHEIGHAAAGALVGFRIFGVTIGTGPRWARFRLGRVRIELRGLGVGGATLMASPSAVGYRWRELLSVLGGPSASAALTLATFIWWPEPSDPRSVWPDRTVAVALGLLVVAGNLWPRLVQTGHGVLASDGLLAVRALRLTPAEVAERVAMYPSAEVLEHLRDGDSAAAAVAVDADRGGIAPYVRAVVLHEAGRSSEAAAAVRESLATATDPKQRAMLRNDLAYFLVGTGDPAALAEADEASSEAIATFPDAPAVRDTRGLVLTRVGRHAEAVSMLEPLARDRRLAPAERAGIRTHLAEARLGLGDLDGGRRDLASALLLDGTNREARDLVESHAAVEARAVIGGLWLRSTGTDAQRGRALGNSLGAASVVTVAALRALGRRPPDEVATVVDQAHRDAGIPGALPPAAAVAFVTRVAASVR